MKNIIIGVLIAISLILFLLLAIAVQHASAANGSATITWDANSESDLAGYKVYMGVASRDYRESRDVGLVTRYTWEGLDAGVKYYFAVTAYDDAGNESDFSQEVSGTIPGDAKAPNPPTNIRIEVQGETATVRFEHN